MQLLLTFCFPKLVIRDSRKIFVGVDIFLHHSPYCSWDLDSVSVRAIFAQRCYDHGDCSEWLWEFPYEKDKWILLPFSKILVMQLNLGQCFSKCWIYVFYITDQRTTRHNYTVNTMKISIQLKHACVLVPSCVNVCLFLSTYIQDFLHIY